MSSSPITDAVAQPGRAGHLLELLATVPDPRDPRGVRYPLAGVLAVAVTAVLAGARSFAAIGEWSADLPREHLTRIGLGSSASSPDESTLRKLFARLDADRLDRVLGAWLWTRSDVVHGQRVIALDGKTVRGARTATTFAPHLVAALDHTTGTVIGQVQVAAKSNEIPAVRDLLAGFDLTGGRHVDAMHTQTDTATAITTAGASTCSPSRATPPPCIDSSRHCPGKTSPRTARPSSATADERPAPSSPLRPPHGSASLAPPRSPRSAAPSAKPARRASRSST